jgi:hypothetical protein
MTSEAKIDPRQHLSTLRLEPSFGFGDRTGLATPGHIAAMRAAGSGIRAIYPQQSIREMTRTARTAEGVMQDALRAMQDANWQEISGADADHLKTEADIDVTFSAGFCFYTLDPSDDVDPSADDYDESQLREMYQKVAAHTPWVKDYVGRTVKLPHGTKLNFSEEVCQRAAVKYGLALQRAIRLAEHLRQIHQDVDQEYEIELSVDETPQPTTLEEHYIVAEQCLLHHMPLVSLAPRFPGDFEKGVDYKGSAEVLRQSLRDHAAIASQLGPYKLSLHSGSDKLSMYGWLAAATEGRFHVKTAGTSYLEALRVAARHDEPLLRRIVDFSRDRFEIDKATYHLSATLDSVPPTSELATSEDVEVVYLERWQDVAEGKGFTNPGRQIVHCTFGSVLTDPELGKELRQVLTEHQDTYTAVLEDHFSRHLRALQSGL